MLTPNPNVTFPVIVTSATDAQMATPIFAQLVQNWRQMAKRIVIVVPTDSTNRTYNKIRYVLAPTTQVKMKDVLKVAEVAMEGLEGHLVIMDPSIVMRFGIFDIFGIAAKRQLGSAWMATGLCRQLPSYMETGPLEADGLRWFCTSLNVIEYFKRDVDPDLPFVSGLWGGHLATWASTYLHAHKYHDVTGLNALGVLDLPEDPITSDLRNFWSQKASFNPPTKSFVK